MRCGSGWAEYVRSTIEQMIRKLVGCLVRLWLCAIQTICGKKKHEDCSDGDQWSSRDGGPGSDDQWNVDGWEDFSVKVVPSVDSSESVPQDGTAGVSEHSVPEALQQEEQDLFEDMKPVFQKPKKIHIHNSIEERHEANYTKFAVQDSLFRQEAVGELGAWSEDEGEDGWEDELAPDEGHLIQYSQEAMKRKKAHEREKRRKAQEALRNQQRINNSSLRLGTRVS